MYLELPFTTPMTLALVNSSNTSTLRPLYQTASRNLCNGSFLASATSTQRWSLQLPGLVASTLSVEADVASSSVIVPVPAVWSAGVVA